MCKIQKFITRLAGVSVSLLLLFSLSPVAHAQFPGTNGRILWVGNHYYTAKPDGSNLQDTNIAHIPFGESAPPWEGIYTPDGAYIIYADDDVTGASNLYITNAANTITPVKLTNFTDCYAVNPAVNSDYTKLALSAYCTSTSTGEIYVLDLNTSGATPTAGTPTKLTNQILLGAGYSSTPVWAPDNSVIYIAANDYSGSNYKILSISPSTANQASGTTIYTSTSSLTLQDVTPDGSKLLYYSYVSSYQLYTVTTSGASNTNINNNSSNYYGGYFSPDGSKILATKRTGSTYYVMTMNADGSAENALLTSTNIQDVIPYFRPSWSTSQASYASASNNSKTPGVADTASATIAKLQSNPLALGFSALGLLSLLSVGAYWLRTELKTKK